VWSPTILMLFMGLVLGGSAIYGSIEMMYWRRRLRNIPPARTRWQAA